MTDDSNFQRFLALAQAAHGSAWQGPLARQLGVAPRTVRRWVTSREVPAWVVQKLAGLGTDPSPSRNQPEWVLGDGMGPDGQVCSGAMLVRAIPPRFMVRLVDVEEADENDIQSGLHVSADGWLVTACAWFDSVPPDQHAQWFERAASAADALCMALAPANDDDDDDDDDFEHEVEPFAPAILLIAPVPDSLNESYHGAGLVICGVTPDGAITHLHYLRDLAPDDEDVDQDVLVSRDALFTLHRLKGRTQIQTTINAIRKDGVQPALAMASCYELSVWHLFDRD